MDIEEAMGEAYRNSFPGEKAFAPLVVNPWKAMQDAKPVEDVIMSINASDQDIYYSFLQSAVKTAGVDNWDDKSLRQLNHQVAQGMWQTGMDMTRMIRCLAYSPLYHGLNLETRYLGASIFLKYDINPVLGLPELAAAKPIMQLDRIASEPHDIYLSYLKATLQRSPSLRLVDADIEVVRALRKDEFSMERTRGCLEDSLQFPMPEHTQDPAAYLLAAEKVVKARNAFFADAWEKTAPTQTRTEENPVKGNDDDALYEVMFQKLRNTSAKRSQENVVSYWTTIMATMRDTLVQLQKAQCTCKVLNLWTVGIEKAAQDLQIEPASDIKELQKKTQQLQQQAEYTTKEWSDIYEIAQKLDQFSVRLLEESARQREANPILQIPEVKAAVSLEQSLKEHRASANVYFAALRAVVYDQPKIMLDRVDTHIVSKLAQHGCSGKDIMQCLLASPCLRQLTVPQRIGAARQIMETHQHVVDLERGGPVR